jgi:5-methylcytosine-specific restriction enzyme subunit McrC
LDRRRVLDLIEHRDLHLEFDQLAPGEAVALTSDSMARVEVVWPNPSNGRIWILRAKGWVGTLPVGHDLTVRVTPKVPVPRVFELWTLAGGGANLRLLDGLAPTATVESALDTVLGLLCDRVGCRIARGLRKGYAPERRSGQVPRGRVRTGEMVRSFSLGRPILVWDERPLTPDIDDNRILAWTLRQASRTARGGGALGSEIVRLERHLAALTTVRSFEPRDCRERSYDRSSADYGELHSLCALVLEGVGPSTGIGHQDFLSFGVYMPTLFERAVAVMLHAGMGELNLLVKPKIPLGRGMSFEPDLVVQDRGGRVLAVMDTKYKASVVDSDVQQVVAYAAALGTELAFLIYPTAVEPERLRAGRITVVPACFDLDLPPSASASRLVDLVRHETSAAAPDCGPRG